MSNVGRGPERRTSFQRNLRRPSAVPSQCNGRHSPLRGMDAVVCATGTAESRESRAEQHLTVEVEAAHAMVGLLGEIEEAALRIDGETEQAVA
jgi:hypothetical protein